MSVFIHFINGDTQTMAHYTQYLKHHVDLLQEFKAASASFPPLSSTLTETSKGDEHDFGENDEWIATLDQLCQMHGYSESMNEKGQWLISRIVSTYSHLMPILNRDLLWFFGGNCLHYMPDEEIALYQQLDELRFSAENAGHDFNYAAAKHSLIQPH
ncbi:MAG: hypothetical protein ACI8VC_000895 [Candidatus Endobugula sp.]|jgi:hypothetical protein